MEGSDFRTRFEAGQAALGSGRGEDRILSESTQGTGTGPFATRCLSLGRDASDSGIQQRGSPIQELAGHVSLSTTQRYMHMSPAAIESAIRLLDRPGSDCESGDRVETDSPSKDKAST